MSSADRDRDQHRQRRCRAGMNRPPSGHGDAVLVGDIGARCRPGRDRHWRSETAPITAPQAKTAMNASAQIGRSGKPKRLRRRRRAQTSADDDQPAGDGADDPAPGGAERALDAAADQPGSACPSARPSGRAVTHQAAPRQTSRPPSVTMKDGIAEIGDDAALEHPDRRRRARTATRTAIGAVSQMLEAERARQPPHLQRRR